MPGEKRKREEAKKVIEKGVAGAKVYQEWLVGGMWTNRQMNEIVMQKRNSKSARNGINGSKSLKSVSGGSRKNGHVHVISPATASEIRRAIGIKPSHTKIMMRAFAAAGVKV